MNSYRIAMSLMAIFMAGCDVMSPNQALVIERAQSISKYPVSRSEFVRALELSKIDSDRTDIGLRAGWLSFVETWDHPSGLRIFAYDRQHFGMRSIGTLKNTDFTAQTSGVTVRGIPAMPTKSPARESFEQVIITKKSGRELFRSSGQSGLVEQ